MSSQPQRHYSLDDYFAVEESSPLKHEFLNGEIFAMAGASVEHLHITGNLVRALRTRLRGSDCNAFGTDLRIATPAGVYTYPDVAVICGPLALQPGRPATATNPVILIEVLSDATRDYDRGEKFDLYRSIPTLREYVLIEQREIRVEQFRLVEGAWKAEVANDPSAALELAAVPIALPLIEIYEHVFPADS
jgi:Uma2 family endonuclease